MPKFLNNIDLAKNELQNALVHKLAAAPASPAEGQIYYNTVDEAMLLRDGTSFKKMLLSGQVVNGDIAADAAIAYSKLNLADSIVAGDITAGAVGNSELAADAVDGTKIADNAIGNEHLGDGVVDTAELAAGAVTSEKIENGTIVDEDISASAAIALSKLATDPLARANHTGTQTASTISDFDSAVQGNTLDSLANPIADLDLDGHKITDLGAPVNGTDAATKAYVDGVAQGLNVKQSVRAIAMSNLDLSGLETIDGVVLADGERVLVNGQTAGEDNGIYVVNASGAWTRAADLDDAAELKAGVFTFVEEGTNYGDSGWVLVSDNPLVLGTDPVEFSQFSGAGQITAGDGLTKSGNTINAVGTADRIDVSADAIDIASTYAGQSSIDTVGSISTGTWEGTEVAVQYGGTGASDALNARYNLSAVTTGYATIGDGINASWPINHDFGTKNVIVQVFDNASGEQVYPDVTVTSTQVTLGFAVAPTEDKYFCVMQGIQVPVA